MGAFLPFRIENCFVLIFCREIKGESGEWFYGSLPKKKKIQYGSTLLKKLIRRRELSCNVHVFNVKRKLVNKKFFEITMIEK